MILIHMVLSTLNSKSKNIQRMQIFSLSKGVFDSAHINRPLKIYPMYANIFALQKCSVPRWLRRCGLPRGVDKSQRLPASSADGSARAIPIIPIRGNWCVIDVLAESGQPALEAVRPNRALRGRSSFLLWPRFLPFSTSSHPSSIQSAPPRVVGCLLGIDILAKCSSRWIPKGTSRSQAYSISLRFFKIITPLQVISIRNWYTWTWNYLSNQTGWLPQSMGGPKVVLFGARFIKYWKSSHLFTSFHH